MSLNRILLLIGALVASGGSLGLIFFGSPPVRVLGLIFEGIDSKGVVHSFDSMWGVLLAAFCKLLLSVGLVTVCFSLGVPSRQQSISLVGRVLVVLGGVGVFIAGLTNGWGLLGMFAFFNSSANGTTNLEDFWAVNDLIVSIITVGHVILLVAVVLPALAALVGFSKQPTDGSFELKPLLAAPLAALAGIFYVVLSFVTWQQSTILKTIIVATDNKGVSLQGEVLGAMLRISLAGCVILMLLGGLLGMAGLLAPKSNGTA